MSIFFPHKKEDSKIDEMRVHKDEALAINQLSEGLNRLIHITQKTSFKQEIVVVCVGTDRSTGDCLGPLIGTQLKERKRLACSVYGTLDHPVHASNLAEYLEKIKSSYTNPLIVAIDACLGKLDSVGYITLREGPLKPGAGVNKNLPNIGDMHITGIVNVGGFMEYFVLQNTRLSIVMKMAHIISRGIERGCTQYKNTQSKG